MEIKCSEREILIICTWLDGDSQGGLPLEPFQIGVRGKKSESSPGRFFRPFLDGTRNGPAGGRLRALAAAFRGAVVNYSLPPHPPLRGIFHFARPSDASRGRLWCGAGGPMWASAPTGAAGFDEGGGQGSGRPTAVYEWPTQADTNSVGEGLAPPESV